MADTFWGTCCCHN